MNNLEGWGEPAGYSGHFVVRLQKKITNFGVFKGDSLLPSVAEAGNAPQIGAYVEFEVETDNRADKEKFYSAFYRASFLPRTVNDVDGRYPSFATGTPIVRVSVTSISTKLTKACARMRSKLLPTLTNTRMAWERALSSGGLSGNDDAGQMSAWYIFSAMGFYPVCPGTPYYMLASPSFPSLTLNLENGKTFKVKAENASEKNIYIQSVKLNGKAYTRNYISHQQIMDGGVLEFVMGQESASRT